MSTKIAKPFAKRFRQKSTRINLRVGADVKASLVRAAGLQKLKLTEFMVRCSQEAAESALAERSRFILTPEKWRTFNAALDAPPHEVPALRKLLTEPSVFEQK